MIETNSILLKMFPLMLFLKYAFFVFKFFEDGTEFHLHSKRIGRRDDEFCVFLSFGNDGQVEFRNGY